MVTKEEVIEQYDIEAMDEADNVDPSEDDLENGSRVSSLNAPGSCATDGTS